MREAGVILCLLLFAAAASAQDGCIQPAESSAIAAAGHYVVVDLCPLDACLYSFWLHEETNGIEGLQRGDAFVDLSCQGIPVDAVVAGQVEPMPR